MDTTNAAVAVVAVCDAAHPGDTADLERWLLSNPDAEVLCVLGKTEGNGCVNDFTRGFATMAITRALERTNRLPPGKEPPAIIMSGGTEGT
jgi:cyanuric acid amidohydrolase